MKRFQYSLQRVMDYRAMQEEQRRMELFRAQQRLYRAQRELEELEEEYRRVLLGINKPGGQALTAHFLRQREKYLEYQGSRIEAQQEKVAEARQDVQACLNRVQEAQAELKKLDRHREKRLAEWEQERRKNDVAKMDEFNMNTLSRPSE